MASLELEQVLNSIDLNTTKDELERLKLLAAAVEIPYQSVEDKRPSEIYRKIEDKYKEEPNALAVFKRLLRGAGVAVRFTDLISQLKEASQPTPDLPKLYFFEFLVTVADQIGNGEDFRYLRNRVPKRELDVNKDGILTCVGLFRILERKRVLDPSKPKVGLEKLEVWLKDINRNDVAEIVRCRIDEINEYAQPLAQGGIQPHGDVTSRPVQETQRR